MAVLLRGVTKFMNTKVNPSQVRSLLRGLNGSSNGEIDASIVISTDGFPIASVLKDDVDGDRYAAMSASLLSLATRTIAEINIGKMRQVMVMGTEGIMLLNYVSANTVLAVSARPKANLGKILLDTKNCVARLQTLFTI